VKWLIAFANGIDRLNTWVGKSVRWLAVVIMVILLYETIARTAFNAPTIWTTEVLMFILAGYFLLAAGYALLHGIHIRMDALYNRWSRQKQAIVNLATFPLAVTYLILLVWTSAEHAWASMMRQEHSTSLWAPPVYPLKIAIPVGVGLFLLQLIAFLIRDIVIIRGSKK